MRKILIAVILLIIAGVLLLTFRAGKNDVPTPGKIWSFQSIDTMKYSRDVSREKLNDPSFDIVIDQQVKNIAATGATHVAIATPYDKEFEPILTRWVNAARKYELNVWFRGNFSGWEKWFGYSSITRDQHKEMTRSFIFSNKRLFKDGDIFTACPECENGGPGDPRHNGDVSGHKKFLIEEHEVTISAFEEIDVDVTSNINSMNGDVARLIMDPETTKALGGIVAVDHYVRDVDTLVADIKEYAEMSGGKVVLGEFGAPIPDIHGEFTQEQQDAWLRDAFKKLSTVSELTGMNYWTNVGGSTELWNGGGAPRLAVSAVTEYYNPKDILLLVKDEIGNGIQNAEIRTGDKVYTTNGAGIAMVPILGDGVYKVSARNYSSKEITLTKGDERLVVILPIVNESNTYKFKKFLSNPLKN